MRVDLSWIEFMPLQKRWEGPGSPSCEDAVRGTICEEEEQPSPDIESAGFLISDFSISRSVRNKLILFINYPVFFL